MAEDSSNNGIIKVGNNTITRYSNALIRRGIQDLAKESSHLISTVNKGQKILLLADPNEAGGQVFSELLEGEGFNVTLLAPYNRLELVYSELGQNYYDMVIATNYVLTPPFIRELVEEIRRRFPKIKIIVCSGYANLEFAQTLWRYGTNDFISIPYDTEYVLNRISYWFSTEKITLLLSHYLGNVYPVIYQALGFNVLWAEANIEELERIIRYAHIDLAIEWQHGARDFPLLNLLKKHKKDVPIFLSLNWNLKPPDDLNALGYGGTLQAAFNYEEMREKFYKVLPPEKQEILKKTEFWMSK